MKAIREAAIQEYANRKSRLLQALSCDEHNEIPRQQLAGQHFPPVRSPSMYSTGGTGTVQCYKAGGPVRHESLLERDCYKVMEWDYTVDTFAVQPFKIPYRRADGKVDEYVPDVMAISYHTFHDRGAKYQPTVFEIKPTEVLREDWLRLKPKLRAGRGFLQESGFRFRLLTEKQLNPIFVQNINFLLSFRGPRFVTRTKREDMIIECLINEIKRLHRDFTPRELLDELGGDIAPRAQVVPWLWNLYADYVVQCDLLKPLTLDTVSWRCGDAGYDFPNTGFANDRPDWRQPENDWRR